MARRLRSYVPDLSLHVFNRGNNRGTIFHESLDREWFLVMLQRAFARQRVDLHTFVLMDTHYHLMVTPTGEHALPNAMKELDQRYSVYFNAKYRRTGGFWEGRYNAVEIDDESYCLVCQRYIEQNPVRAAIVNSPEAYQWSSYRVHALGHSCTWLVPHATYLALGHDMAERQAAYRALCAEPVPDEAIVRLRGRSRSSAARAEST
jgi:putative transposase